MRFLRTRVTSFAASRKDGAQILLLPRLTLNLQAWVYSSISSRKPTMHASCDCDAFSVLFLSGTSALRSSFDIKLSCSNHSPRHDLNTIQFEKPFVYPVVKIERRREPLPSVDSCGTRIQGLSRKRPQDGLRIQQGDSCSGGGARPNSSAAPILDQRLVWC